MPAEPGDISGAAGKLSPHHRCSRQPALIDQFISDIDSMPTYIHMHQVDNGLIPSLPNNLFNLLINFYFSTLVKKERPRQNKLL